MPHGRHCQGYEKNRKAAVWSTFANRQAAVLGSRRNCAFSRSKSTGSVMNSAAPYSLATRRRSEDRLESTRLELYTRIEGSVLGLEGLVARLAEIVALSDAGTDVASVDDVAFELDTLRTALVESEELGRLSVHALIAPIERGGQ